ncbi:MAG: calcium-binding protein, partial [Cyanobacteria bacterium P01_H01_bin.105]
TIDYSGVTFASGNVTINLATAFTSVAGGNTERIFNFENVEGSQGGETIIGTLDVNVINGNDGDDIILAGQGNDTITGGAGDDYLNGTNFTAQGTRERDTLISGGLDDTDIFVLGERQGLAGRVFYNDLGNADYAILQDFDVYNFPGDIADKIQLLGSASNYRISNIMVDGISGAGISFQGDLIGVVQGVGASNLNLNDSNQFMYV